MAKDWLKLDEIGSRLEGRMDQQMVEQFHQNKEVRELLGAHADEYPIWSLRYWRYLAEVRERACEPESAGAFLRALIEQEGRPADEEEAEEDEAPEGMLAPREVKAAAEAFAEALVRRAKAEGLFPLQEDRLIGKDEAGRLLNCTPQSVSRRVRPLQPGTWSYLQIQEFIAGLRDANR